MRKALRDLSAWSTDQSRRLGLLDLLSEGAIERVHWGLGGSHTVVTYPPLDALLPLEVDKVAVAVRPASGFNLYAHIAFCEHMCPFCHYAKTYSPIGQEGEFVRSYLDALQREIKEWAGMLAGSTVSSVYIGGGTPTAVSTAKLVRIVERLCAFPTEQGLRVCVETSPLTTVSADGPGKLSALVAAGVNRFSIGIQTFDEELLRRTRGHGQGEARKALATLADLGVEFNIDLMQDLPHQTEQSLIDDLRWIDVLRPHQVTWYLLRVHPESPFFHLYQRGDLELPTAAESARRRLLVREGMRRIGYTVRPGGRFVLDTSIHDQFKEVRAGAKSTLLGMGVSAYSHGWGYFFRNNFSASVNSGIRGYVERIRQRGLAVESGLQLNQAEVVAGTIVAGIRSGTRLPEAEPETELYLNDVSVCLEGLRDAGLVHVDHSGTWSLTELGWIFEEEICSLFYSNPVKQRLAERNCYWVANRMAEPSVPGGPDQATSRSTVSASKAT